MWPDGKEFHGRFQDGLQDGWGAMTSPTADGPEVYEGYWKAGKMHGLGCLK